MSSKQDNITENLKLLSSVLETGKSAVVEHEILGDIVVYKGSVKTEKSNGEGLLHIIEDRTIDDNRDTEFITALLPLIIESLRSGVISQGKLKRIILEKNGIIAIVSKDKFGKKEQWLLTGFDSNKKKQEATDAIQAASAKYGYTANFSDLQKLVGAVASQVNTENKTENVNQNFTKNDKEKNMETRKNAVPDYFKIGLKYQKNEDENMHSENTVLLAKYFGNVRERIEADEILHAHQKFGSIDNETSKKRNALDKVLWEQAKEHASFMLGYQRDDIETRQNPTPKNSKKKTCAKSGKTLKPSMATKSNPKGKQKKSKRLSAAQLAALAKGRATRARNLTAASKKAGAKNL